jgi:hypothetical protein
MECLLGIERRMYWLDSFGACDSRQSVLLESGTRENGFLVVYVKSSPGESRDSKYHPAPGMDKRGSDHGA